MKRHIRAMGVLWVGSVLFLLTALQFPQTVDACGKLGKGLVGWWRFDEGVGTVALDSSGYENNGTIIGETAFTTDALLGTAVDFYESGGIVVEHHPSLEPATGTIEVWLRVAEQQNTDLVRKTTTKLVNRGDTGSFSVYGFRIHDDGSVSATIMNDDLNASFPWTAAFTPPDMITIGEWTHAVMRWDGDEVAVFVNGKLRARQTYVPVPELGLSYHGGSIFGLAIGTTWGIPGSHEFVGQLDEVRIYARALSNGEIRRSYLARGHEKPGKHTGQWKRNLKKKLKKYAWKHRFGRKKWSLGTRPR